MTSRTGAAAATTTAAPVPAYAGHDEPYLYVDPGMTDTNKSFGPKVVPAGELWVMGDHRNMSQDSRFVGAVPKGDVIGRAFVVIWPPSRWKFLSPRSYGGIPAHVAGASPMLLAGAVVLAGSGLLAFFPVRASLAGRAASASRNCSAIARFQSRITSSLRAK